MRSKGLALIPLIIGLVFAGIGVFFIVKDNNNKQYYATTTAVIVDIDEDTTIVYKDGVREKEKQVEYDVYLDYEVDGKKYERVRYNTYYAGMKVGDTITINYDVRDPGKPFSQTSNKVLSIMFIVIGSITAIFSGVGFVRELKTKGVQID